MVTKVQLRKNIRMYEGDDSSFFISGEEIKELPEKHLRSYSLKYYLFHGLLKVVEGELILHMKSSVIYIAKEKLYSYEFGKYYKKNLETDEIFHIKEEDVPKNILIKINPKISIEQETTLDKELIPDEDICSTDNAENVIEDFEEVNFNNMTRTELLQYAKEHNISHAKNIKVGELRELLNQ